MKKLYLLPYRMGSASAKLLAKALGILRLKPSSPKKIRDNHTVVNWGVGRMPHPKFVGAGSIVNKFWAVGVARNKLTTLNALVAAGIMVPDYTTSKDLAAQWIISGRPVLARRLLHASAGAGIVGPLTTAEELPDAPLYVKYIKKAREYRVHVFHASCLIHQKKRRTGAAVDYHIRSHANGWVFCNAPNDPLAVRLSYIAVQAVEALQLDFGAVDIIYNEKHDTLYVLEVNTAPGIEKNNTLEFYTNSIKTLHEER